MTTGVSRQTLYNRWETVGDIVLDALLTRGEHEIGLDDRDPATSSATDYLPRCIEELAAALTSWAAPGLKAVAALAQRDAAFAERFRTGFVEPRRQRLAEVVCAACAGSDKDAPMLTEFIVASMWYRLLMTGQPLDERWIDNMVALCLGGATTDR